ncbi:MAG TPA: serine/threonine-protein kinase PknK, partial [Polyangiaceae bacterium]|nr:serine/threonine-protein kinase PknK [Polyangiaceae bacterium]
AALGALRDRPFFVLALARPEVRERFADPWAGREVQEMRLGGLTRRAAAQLVRHALPEAGEGLVGRLVERADGNALYLEELVRAAAAGRADALPETIAAMLQASLGALAPEQRRLLRAASTFGEVFWPSGVQVLLGAGQRLAPVAEGLEALIERELLVRRPGGRFPAEPELGFRHALVRDSAYATFPEADRARAHRAAARWLEQTGEADPLVLAAHYERGGEPARAAACYHRAAALSLAGNDPPGALAYAERALALGPDEALRPWVLHSAAQAACFGGRLAEAKQWADQVLATTPRGSRVWCLGFQLRFLISFLSIDPEFFSFGIAVVEGLEASAENAAPLIQILSSLALFLGAAGQRPLAMPYLERAEALVEELHSSVDESSLAMFHLNRSNFRFGVELDFEAALRDGEQAIRYCRAVSDRLREGAAHQVVGFILCYLGAFERALAELHCAVEGAPSGAPSRPSGRAWKAVALVELGAREEAEREASRALAEAQAANNRLAEAEARRALACALQACGKPTAAERVIREGLALGIRTVPQLVDFRIALAEARLAQDRADEALTLAREVATSQGETLRLAWLKASAVQAEALRAVGDHAAARALLVACRAELLALAARIADDELRASFLGRGLYTARLLRLAEAEGVGAGAGG